MALESLNLTQNHVESMISDEQMANIHRYRECVKMFLLGQCDLEGTNDVVSVPVFDEMRDRYLVLCHGWRGQERVYWVVLHLEIREGRVWIERNQTEVDVEAELMVLGVAKGDLVRGGVPPEYRMLAGLQG